MAQGERRLSQRKTQRRQEKQDRRAKRQLRARLLRWSLFGLVGLIALTLIVGLLVVPGLIPTGGAKEVLSAESRLQGPGDHLDMQPAYHIPETEVSTGYNSFPPTSGSHWAVPAEWGIHKDPVPNERQVHNLEHGGINLQYNTQDAGIIDNLENLAHTLRGFPACIIVAPYPNMETTIAITAWGVLLSLDAFNEDAIRDFANFYRDQGPERIACRGSGSPM